MRLRFLIFFSLFFLSLYFLSYIFLCHKIYSLFLFLHPKNKTLAHLPLSVGNHPRVVLHHFIYNRYLCVYSSFARGFNKSKILSFHEKEQYHITSYPMGGNPCIFLKFIYFFISKQENTINNREEIYTSRCTSCV